MCTPQLVQQAVESGQAAGIIPGQQVNPRPAQPQLDPRWASSAGQISELFDMNNGQRISGPPVSVPMVPISREEFINDAPLRQIPMMVKQNAPIRREPTVGELLGIPPGSVPGI